MLIQEVIKKKRNNQLITEEEISAYINGVSDGSVSEGQIAAMCMAIYFNKLSISERSMLTLAMRDSGQVLSWKNLNLNGPVVDKHSTGGVGDVVSLILAPMLSACGAYVPMISGRGLGHTGGTLDKLSAIPGFDTFPSVDKLTKIIQECGAAIIGQTDTLAPADRTIYATRDVTGTVESIDLITASILSKKLAEGLDCLVMDVKVGNGAFMSSYEDSVALAKSIVDVANHSGCQTTAVLTDMNQVLASSAGNAIEVREAIKYLRNEQVNSRLHEINLALCEQLLMSGGLAKNKQHARQQLEHALYSGKALECFAKMIVAQGGPADFTDCYDKYFSKAPVIKPLLANEKGKLVAMDTYRLGIAVIELGGGRRIASDIIDLSVGFDEILPLGSMVEKGTPLVMIHAKDEAAWDKAANNYLGAVTIDQASESYSATPEIYQIIN